MMLLILLIGLLSKEGLFARPVKITHYEKPFTDEKTPSSPHQSYSHEIFTESINTPEITIIPEKKMPAKPRVSCVLIVDQLAYNTFEKYIPYAQDGFKLLMNEGIVYSNITHPHGNPTTGTGHTAIVTGALPFQHGIIDNHWFDSKTNRIVGCDEDPSPDAAVFNPDGGVYKENKSSHFLAVDTLPDQFALASHEKTKHHSLAFSLKSRSANMPAGRAGKAIWLDDLTGKFTSTKAYYSTLPSWIEEFNEKHGLVFDKPYHWQPVYKEDFEGYQFPFTKRHEFTAFKKNIIGTNMIFKKNEKGFEKYVLLPESSKHLLNLVKHYTNTVITKNPDDRYFMTISLSSFDLIAHLYGQDSLESIDMFFHLDRYIGDFIRTMQSTLGADNVFFALTADHGSMPIPEIAKLKGINNATRIVAKDIVNKINDEIAVRYGLSNFVSEFNSPNLFLNQAKLSKCSPELKQKISETIKNLIYKHVPGVVTVWNAEELLAMTPTPGSREELMKNSIFPGRSGQIICLLRPYHQLTLYSEGTGHCTPYWYDLQVPLILYQKGMYEKKRINKPQLMTQFAATMAHILGIQKPSCSNPHILKGIA